jgi:hypothetical protein
MKVTNAQGKALQLNPLRKGSNLARSGLAFSKYASANPVGAQHRVGVPGHKNYQYGKLSHVFSWTGSSFQAVLTHGLYWIHFFLFLAFCILHDQVSTIELHAAEIPDYLSSTLQTISVFAMVFYTGRVMHRWNERFHDVCKTNGAVTVVSGMCAGYLGGPAQRRKGISLIRYTNCILHLYYMMLGGPLNDEKYRMLIQRGMLTNEEATLLKSNGSPGVVVYSWCASICRSAYEAKELSTDQEAALMANISTARGLGAKQIAYTLTQMPLAYFQLMALCINSFALCSSWNAAHNFSREHLTGCSNNAAYGAYTAPTTKVESLFTNPSGSKPGRIWQKPGTGMEYMGGEDSPKCYSAMITIFICQTWLLFIICALFMVAVWMSDPMGENPSCYDVSKDLENLWNESLNMIDTMQSNVGTPALQEGILNEEHGRGSSSRDLRSADQVDQADQL